MTFLELAKARYSVRAYKDTPIEEEKMPIGYPADDAEPAPMHETSVDVSDVVSYL